MERVFTPAGRDLFDQLASPVTQGGGWLMGECWLERAPV